MNIIQNVEVSSSGKFFIRENVKKYFLHQNNKLKHKFPKFISLNKNVQIVWG